MLVVRHGVCGVPFRTDSVRNYEHIFQTTSRPDEFSLTEFVTKIILEVW